MKRLVAAVLAALLAVSAGAQAPSPPTRIYIGNDDHTDYMWATDAETYDAIFVEMLDFHLGLLEQTKATRRHSGIASTPTARSGSGIMNGRNRPPNSAG